MNNDKNVYILGAGFSREMELPLQDDFLLVAKDVYFRNPIKYRHFDNIFEYQNNLSKMKNFLSYPLLNLEHLFNSLEMDYYYSNREDVNKLKTDFIKLIADVLKELTPTPFYHDARGHICFNHQFNNYLKFLKLFIKSDKLQRKIDINQDTIISFNYDLILEATVSIYNWKRNNEKQRAMDYVDLMRLNTTFGKSNIIVKNMSECFRDENIIEDIYNTKDIFVDNVQNIKLIKLHGSINWHEPSKNDPFIIPPTWNKSDARVTKLWKTAYEELKTAKRIIIIGYSFPQTDTYVESLLALALNENKVLQNIFFINPDKDSVKSRCINLLDKHFQMHCEYKEWGFSEFIEAAYFIDGKLNRQF